MINKCDKKEIQRKADRLLEACLDEIFSQTGYKIRPRPQNDQLDKGVDLEVEVEDRTTGKTKIIFKIQNKGTFEPNKKFSLLTTTENNGLRSWQIEIGHVNYYRNEINIPVIYTICDLTENKIYWHAIQLDTRVEKTIEIALEKAKKKDKDRKSTRLNSSH